MSAAPLPTRGGFKPATIHHCGIAVVVIGLVSTTARALGGAWTDAPAAELT